MHLTDAYTKLTSLYAATPLPLLHEALMLVANGAVTERDGTFTIRYGKDGDEEVATVEGGACDCDPLSETREVCAHVIAAELYGLLREEQPPRGPLDGPLLERHIERVVSGSLMGEAPYSLNMTVEDMDGYNLMFTVRKQEGREFFKASTELRKWIKEQGFVPKQWKAPVSEALPTQRGTLLGTPVPEATTTGPPLCQWHGPMKESTKAVGTWYCTKKMADGTYCKEKSP